MVHLDALVVKIRDATPDPHSLEIGCFEDNKTETNTMIPVIKAFRERHGVADTVVVADAGMLSAANLKAVDEAGLRFIVGFRMTKAPHDLAKHLRWHGTAFSDGQVIDTITMRSTAPDPDRVRTRAEPVWDPGEHPQGVARGVGILDAGHRHL